MSLKVSSLTKKYGEQVAVNNISFSVSKGEIVGFLGPNGAGKSTTMKMITGYLKPFQGKVLVGEIDALEQPLEAKKKIGYLPEANPLYYEMYVREYLGFVASIHQLQHSRQKIENVIRTVGLSLESHKKAGQLSKGYKQRLGLAAALVHDPEVLILDEPTSGLDPNQIAEIRSVIKTLSADKTVLFSTHIMQEVEALCDRVIIINKGNIVADDNLGSIRQRTAAAYIQVQFEETVDPVIFNEIKAEQVIAPAPGSQVWKVKTNQPEKTRKDLLQLSIRHNLNIVSLQNDSDSLENIFRSLTA